ncbi:MAG: Ig-like domain-containing protein [Lachnospiraceae bacterium]|nr:Ig-like domain-containing protein [Lachnospiraceae bacterium]
MKRSFSKRAWSAFLALAIIVTAVFGNVTTAKAETTGYVDLVYVRDQTANAYEACTHSFTMSTTAETAILVFVPTAVGVTIEIDKGNVQYASPLYISASDSDWTPDGYGWYMNGSTIELEPGDYSVRLTFDSATVYDFWAYYAAPKAEISEEKVTLTNGFTKKLYVSNGTVTKWSSSKKSVATVDKNGKVTAKKSGKATITATLSDGSKVKCTVTVKDNKYSATKITSSDVSYNEYGAKAYSASFDKNGNLVVKIMIVNGGYGKMTKIPGFRVTVKNQDGKTVGTYKKSSFSVSVPSYSSKSYSVTIKKSSKLSSKKTDLRNSTITVDGGTATVYY